MREPKLIIATGTKGVGKTHTTCSVIQKYIQHNNFNGKEARRVLIFDVNKEYSNEEIAKKGFSFTAPVLALSKLPQWVQQKRVEVRRILAVDETTGRDLDIDGMIDYLDKILYTYRGGMLVLEDINRYLIDTKTTSIVGAMATNRHKDLDIYIHLQSLAPVTTRMWQNCQVVRFHKQIDDVSRYKTRLPNAELYYIVQKLVNTKYLSDKRFYVYVDNELAKVNGKFSKVDLARAVYEYCLENPRVYLSVAKRYGNDIHANNKALYLVVNDKTNLYYGNE